MNQEETETSKVQPKLIGYDCCLKSQIDIQPNFQLFCNSTSQETEDFANQAKDVSGSCQELQQNILRLQQHSQQQQIEEQQESQPEQYNSDYDQIEIEELPESEPQPYNNNVQQIVIEPEEYTTKKEEKNQPKSALRCLQKFGKAQSQGIRKQIKYFLKVKPNNVGKQSLFQLIHQKKVMEKLAQIFFGDYLWVIYAAKSGRADLRVVQQCCEKYYNQLFPRQVAIVNDCYI